MFWILFTIFLFIFSFKAPLDPDLGWHLRVGQYIANNYNVPHSGIFNWPFADYQFTDFNWLANLGLWLIYSKFGLLVLTLIFAVLIAGFFLWLIIFFRSKSTPVLYNILFFILMLPVLYSIYGVRLQVLSWIYFSFLLFTFWVKPKYQFYLPFLFILWTNTHGSFVLGLGLYFLLIIIEHFAREKSEKTISLKNQLILFLLSIIATFITPYGSGIWQEVLKQQALSEPYDKILEWRSPNFHNENGIFVLIVISALLVLGHFNQAKRTSLRLIILIVTLWLGLFSIRNLPFLLLTAIFFLSSYLTDLVGQPKLTHFLKIKLAVMVILGATIFFAQDLWKNNYKYSLSLNTVNQSDRYPGKIAEYLKAHPELLEKKVFNDYGLGGWLIWNFPKKEWFADGRMAAWKLERNGKKELAVLLHEKVSSANQAGLEYLEEEKIELAIVNSRSSLGKVLKEKSEWTMVISDNDYFLYSKSKN